LDKNLISKLSSILSDKSLKVVIISHVNPDGDAIGSSLALYQYLKSKSFENVEVVIPNMHPSFLTWMPCNDRITTATNKNSPATRLLKDADLIFCVDFNDLERTDQLAASIRNSKAIRVLIDHHPDPKPEFDIMFSYTATSSTSELVYDLIVAMGHKNVLSKDMAACLYAGIITDTGSLSYGCNYPKTYYIIAHLMELGIDGEFIHRLIYDTYSEDRMRLLGYSLSDRLVVLHSCKTAYIHLSSQDLKNFNYKEGDTEGVVNYALSIQGIELAAIFIEKKGVVKISLRSKGDINVNNIARTYFNGGGHKNAAGGRSKRSLDDTVAYFKSIVVEIYSSEFRTLKDV